MSKRVFLTFANTSFMTLDRITLQAEQLDVFDQVYALTEHSIPEYIEKHRDFINQHVPGYGYWIWKPKIILDILQTIEFNDILVYADAGIYINKNGKPRFEYYLDKLREKDIITFDTTYKYLGQQFVKMDAIMAYHPEFKNKRTCCQYAGLMIIKKTQSTIKLITDWLNLCENYHFLDDSSSINYEESSIFVGSDMDNGLFCMCLDRYRDIVFSAPPGEVMIYTKDGTQITHEIHPRTVDWSILNDKPFQCRRMTPNLGFPKEQLPKKLIKWIRYY